VLAELRSASPVAAMFVRGATPGPPMRARWRALAPRLRASAGFKFCPLSFTSWLGVLAELRSASPVAPRLRASAGFKFCPLSFTTGCDVATGQQRCPHQGRRKPGTAGLYERRLWTNAQFRRIPLIGGGSSPPSGRSTGSITWSDRPR
jgi:hypothetical protein